MNFDIHLLDKLDYDDAEPLLDDYIGGAINQFVNSDIGQTYVKTHPEGGNWIGTFIEMAYLYGETTLPKMTKTDVQQVMESILPRKLTLLDPSDTDDAIPELVAFWNFLKQEYKFRSAGAIANYLTAIQDQFSQWMFDPSRGGIAKQFMIQGLDAGFDMTDPEDLQVFQDDYNERIKIDPSAKITPPLPTVPMAAPPPDVQEAFEQMGIELPEPGQPLNPMNLLGQMFKAVGQMDINLDGDEADTPLMLPSNPLATVRTMLMRDQAQPLSQEMMAVLQAQTITATGPGSILRDFQAILAFMDKDGLPVSGKRHQIALKLLPELNQCLCNPIEIDLKRPQQQSYPPLHGLYLLLRATGIAKLVAQGKQMRLVLNPDIYPAWTQLNPTEQYCTLLEAWLVRGHPEMLGEERRGHAIAGERVFQSWQKLATQKRVSYAKYAEQERLNYWPGLYNVALMELFGLLNITAGKPTKGKGWRIRTIETLPWGNALITLLYNAYLDKDMKWDSEQDSTLPLNELQPILSPYFPEWQQTLAGLTFPFRSGRHIFKVSLKKSVWRRIAIDGDATLSALSGLILKSVDFDSDHLDQFIYTNPLGCKVEVVHPYADGDFHTTKVQIGSLPLTEGSIMQYIFDFGDWWEFEVQLETVEPAPAISASRPSNKKNRKGRKTRSRKTCGEIIEGHGKAPLQYPSYDED